MGQEIECRVRYGERSLTGRAYLESDHLLFRGEERLKVMFGEMRNIRAESGVLHLDSAGGPLELELGDYAEKWGQKILNPPSRLHKLGVKAGMAVRMVGEFDADFRDELKLCRVEEAAEQADLIFLAADGKSKLFQIRKLLPGLKADGALWVLYPKGVDNIREIDVLSAGRAASLKDSKVASFSMTHTGLKFVVPLAQRKRWNTPPATPA
jgi:hypothetical protein